MTDAYRQAGGSCPDCSAVLRDHAGRFVCDHCDGMLIAAAEYETSLRDIDGSSSVLAIKRTDPVAATCPRCTRPLATAELSFGGQKLPGRYLSCAQDGVWVPNPSMVGAYAVVGSRAHRGGKARGGVMETAMGGPAGHGGAIAIRSVAGAFANRPQFVALGEVTAKTHTAFVSAFAGQDLVCPKCDAQLVFEADRWACKSCAGSFVEDAALVAMVQDITQAYWEMPAIGTHVGARACPACKTKMVVESFHAVEIDRCQPHGVWFDADELQTVLVESTHPKETGGWLKKLFGRHST